MEPIALVVTGLSIANAKRLRDHIRKNFEFENCVAWSKEDWDTINSRVAFMSFHAGAKELGEPLFLIEGQTKSSQLKRSRGS